MFFGCLGFTESKTGFTESKMRILRIRVYGQKNTVLGFTAKKCVFRVYGLRPKNAISNVALGFTVENAALLLFLGFTDQK